MLKPVRNPDIKVQEIGKETLLYSPEGRAVHVLNPTALLIWNCCDGDHSDQDIARIIRESFAVPEGRDVIQDVHKTLEVFTEKKLVHYHDSSDRA